MECSPVYEQLEKDGNSRTELWVRGYAPWEDRIPLLICSSMGDREKDLSPTHYGFCIGDRARNVGNPETIRGIFGGSQRIMLKEITDGSSNTILLGEIGASGGTLASYAINQPEKFLDEPSKFLAVAMRGGEVDPDVLQSAVKRGGLWAEGRSGAAQFNTILPPNSPSAVIGGTLGGDGFFSASGPHPGTINVAFGDGSTHAISVDIDCGDLSAATLNEDQMKDGVASPYGPWGGLGSANDGTKVDASEY